MAAEIIPCAHGHVIDGAIPDVDPALFETQYPELVGKVCDCKKLIYTEGKCQTCQGEKWRIIWTENNG